MHCLRYAKFKNMLKPLCKVGLTLITVNDTQNEAHEEELRYIEFQQNLPKDSEDK